MKLIRRGELRSAIDSAYVVRLDTGDTQELSVKGESYCHFFEPVYIADYKIIFWLDWSDLDIVGHPTLDADFYEIDTNKKLRNTGELRAVHHTYTVSPKERVYEWEFRDIKWQLKVVIRWLFGARDTAQFSDKAICEVRRNGAKGSQ